MRPRQLDAERPQPRARRRASDGLRARWVDSRTLLVGALSAPLRPPTRLTVALAAVVVVAETVGLAVRLTGGPGLWDMDAIGSVPRTVVACLLAASACAALLGAVSAGRHGAGVWWFVVAVAGWVLAGLKHSSLHSVLEERLAGVLPASDVQLLYVVITCLGLLAVVVSGRWVRRETRTVVATWLALYAVAAVGLSAVTMVLAGLGAVVADVSTWVEETGEGLCAVALLAVLVSERRALALRRAHELDEAWAQPRASSATQVS